MNRRPPRWSQQYLETERKAQNRGLRRRYPGGLKRDISRKAKALENFADIEFVFPVLATANQERELREIAGRKGCEIVHVYKDHGISGAKGRDKRPAYDRLLKDAAQRKFDVVMAWSVDRLGRSLKELIEFLSELHALGIDLFLHQQGLDTATPAGKAMFQMMGVFAEFERSMIQERIRAGLRRAKDEGKQLGRPRIPAELERRILAVLKTPGRTDGVRKIAKRFGVDPSTVQRISRPLAGEGVAA